MIAKGLAPISGAKVFGIMENTSLAGMQARWADAHRARVRTKGTMSTGTAADARAGASLTTRRHLDGQSAGPPPRHGGDGLG